MAENNEIKIKVEDKDCDDKEGQKRTAEMKKEKKKKRTTKMMKTIKENE